jgi:8-oxo-dGTP pyrophosphatase MutT (NUDIX family)
VDDEVVRAAGGVVWRLTPSGAEVLLIHRPKYDDWSLPKGKADPGEDDLGCALREVREETGLACEPTQPLGSTEYTTRKGRPKVVRFWAMRVLRGEFAPNSEVDEVRWIPLREVAAYLTYDREKEVVAGLRDPGAGSEPAPEIPG